jgi:very-short-patch-repair endonuclease
VDVAFPEQKIAVEVHGGNWINGRHNRGAGMETDSEKICLLAGLGWRYLQVTAAQVREGKALKWIEQVLRVSKASTKEG